MPAITMDLTATILAAAGAKPPEGRKLDGIDLTPILDGTKPAPERTLFWRIDRGRAGQWAARKGKWKYIRYAGGELLFDLDADIGERHDLSERDPETVAELREEMARLGSRDGPIAPAFLGQVGQRQAEVHVEGLVTFADRDGRRCKAL